MNQKTVLIIGAIVYLVSAVGTYSYFSRSTVDTTGYKSPSTSGSTGTTADSGPKTEECPMNGALYSKAQKAKWDKRRPLGVAIENSLDSRPQSGLSTADVVYEAVAEGGITRFLAVFYCQEPKIAGPVRSARIYFLRIVQGYGDKPLYAHVGGANTPGPANALGEISDLGWNNYNDMNQFGVPFPYYWRDYDRLPNVATEHTMYTDTTKLWKYAADVRKLSNVDEDGVAWNENWKGWTFTDDAKTKGTVAKISYHFWDASKATYGVDWAYDAQTNSYTRSNGGEPHLDKNTEKPITAKNVIVMLAEESPANDGYEGGHLLYDVIGTGNAVIFQNGKALKGKWNKKDEESMVTFTNASGEEIPMVRGQVFVSIVPTGNEVTY